MDVSRPSKLGLALEAAFKEVVASGQPAACPATGSPSEKAVSDPAPTQDVPQARDELSSSTSTARPAERPPIPGLWITATGVDPVRPSSAGHTPKKRSSGEAFSDAGLDTQDAGRSNEDEEVAESAEARAVPADDSLSSMLTAQVAAST